MDYSSDYQLQATQRRNLLDILQKEKCTDLQFIIGPNKTVLQCNRAFLASISSVFAELLYPDNDDDHPEEIELPDICPSAFQSVLNYAYCNDPQISPENILTVKFICERFNIFSLSKTCTTFWTKNLTPTNLCTLLNQSILINSMEFTKECQEYLVKYAVDADIMVKSTGFLKMNLKSMIVFLQTDNLKIEEHILWEYMLKWAQFQCNNNNSSRSQSSSKITNKSNDGTIYVAHDDDDDDGNEEEKKKDDDVSITEQSGLKNAEEIYPDDMDQNVPFQIDIKQPKDRLNLLKAIKKHIRWGAMNGNYFVKKVKNEGVFEKDELITILTYFQCPDEGCGDFMVEPRATMHPVTVQRGDIELAKWTYPGGRKVDAIAFKSSNNLYLKGVGIFNCNGKCTAKVKVYRGDNGKYNGMDTLSESKEEIFESNDTASVEPIELKLEKAVKIEEYQKYTIELIQKNENDAVSYQIKNGKTEISIENEKDLEIIFSKAAVSKNGTNVDHGAIPTLYFEKL